MPKRKVRSAAQRAASKRNLVKARKARALGANGYRVPTGKTTLLAHRTSPINVKKIMTQGFRAHSGSDIFFSHFQMNSRFDGYGKAVLTVKVPRKLVKLHSRSAFGVAPDELKVASKNLRGRKIRRLK